MTGTRQTTHFMAWATMPKDDAAPLGPFGTHTCFTVRMQQGYGFLSNPDVS